MKKNIIAIVQARSDSSRLPGKVLKKILNKPMIIHQLQRIELSKLINKLLLATSNQTTDDILAQTVQSYNFNIFRGDKDNVLKRYYDSLHEYLLNDDDIIVRLTGDCPLHDSKIIDETIQFFLDNPCDYVSNAINPPVYPDGFDVEVFNYKTLKATYKYASSKSELEHVTPYIRDSLKFNVLHLPKTPIYSNYRLTVDQKEDFIVIKTIFEYFNDTYFTFQDIINYLKQNQSLLSVNSTIQRNEGYKKS